MAVWLYNKYQTKDITDYHTAQNFGGTKLWWIQNCKKIHGENFGG